MIHYTVRKPRNHLTYVNHASLSAKAHNLFGLTLSLKETRTQKLQFFSVDFAKRICFLRKKFLIVYKSV